MKRCAQCHGKLGLGARSRNVWNGRWWVHVVYCSTHCEALPLWHLPEIFMTLQKAKSIARHLGLTLRKVRSGDYRVNFRDGNETTAYYTDNFEDAVNAVVAMARKRHQRPSVGSPCKGGVATVPEKLLLPMCAVRAVSQ